MTFEIRQGTYQTVLNDVFNIDMILTSPPYNVGSKSPAIYTNRKYGGFDAKSFKSIRGYEDNLPEDIYKSTQLDFLKWCSEHISKDGVLVYNHKNRHKNGVMSSPFEWIYKQNYLVVHDMITWHRGSTHNHCKNFVYPESELIIVMKRPGAKIYFKNQDFYWKDEDKRNKGCGDVWRIVPDRKMELDVNGERTTHDAPFPLELARHCIRLWSRPDGLVCDPYLGSGTTLLASVLEGRNCIGSESVKKYSDYARKRLSECLKSADAA